MPPIDEFMPDGLLPDLDAPLTRSNPVDQEIKATDVPHGSAWQGFRFPGNVVEDSRIPVGTVALVNNDCHMLLRSPDGRTVEFDVRDVMLSVDPVRAMSERIILKAGEFGTGSIKGTLQLTSDAETQMRFRHMFGFTEEPNPVAAPEEDLFEDRTW